jgi:choline dehydrogenase-like flavoprotein
MLHTLVGALALAALAPSADALALHGNDAANPNNRHRAMFQREITTDVSKATSQSWDFVIAGGGLAGLALAARLSEWSNQTVLVIEAGSDGSEVQENIDIPGYSYLNSLTNKPQDWQYKIVPQTSAQGAGGNLAWPRGKLLGGSGAINGMFWGRGSKEDYDAWATLNPNGNQTWGWDEVNKYINKAETFDAPPQADIEEFHMPIDNDAHGHDGPIHTGMSAFQYPAVANWIPGWEALGFPAKDLSGGSVRGAMICPSTMFAANQTRCDSKAGYINSIAPRSNLMILTGQQVTKVNFNGTKDANGNLAANGVNFAAGAGGEVHTVTANKEVLLCGGTIGSPQILQLSGIGPKETLEPLKIEVLKDLPVGYNLQDHVSGAVYFKTPDNVDTWGAFGADAGAKAAALEQWNNNRTGRWTYVNEAVGYVSMSDILGGASAASSAANGVDVAALVTQVTNAHAYPASVQQGLAKQYNVQKTHLSDETGQLELILTMLGGDATTVGIQVAIQHPFSRGTLMINSADAFVQPTINPDYMSADIDGTIAVGGLKFARQLGQTPPMASFMQSELYTAGQQDAQLLAGFKTGAHTEFHPCSTCSMLPEDDGGVVDTNLIVYGTGNLRVIDASIIPLHISAHLMATTYGIAEKGADIIKQAHLYVEPAASTTSTGPSSTGTGAAEASQSVDAGFNTDAGSGNDKATSSAMSTNAKIGVGIGVGVGSAALLAALVSSSTTLLFL